MKKLLFVAMIAIAAVFGLSGCCSHEAVYAPAYPYQPYYYSYYYPVYPYRTYYYSPYRGYYHRPAPPPPRRHRHHRH